MKKLRSIEVLLCAIIFFGCVNMPPLMDDEVAADKAAEVLSTMTMEEKVGQLFFINLEGFASAGFTYNDLTLNTNGVLTVGPELVGAIKKYPVGGIIYFGRNVDTPKQLKELSEDLQQASTTPLFIGVDEEGGRVSRIAKDEDFDLSLVPSMEVIASGGRTSSAKKAGVSIGSYLHKYGVNVNFAPVVDINTNPDNLVIGDRAFSSDPYFVAEMADAYTEGLHKYRIMSCIKHFPGHGDTCADTHDGYVSVTKTWEELHDAELIPFMLNMDTADMIMVAHITSPKITTDGLPASLSSQMVQDRLRGELGYDGVVITDAMDMGAVSENYSSANAAICAIEAGVDIILVPYDFKDAYNGVLAAVKTGKISEARIDESVFRILALKMKYNLFNN